MEQQYHSQNTYPPRYCQRIAINRTANTIIHLLLARYLDETKLSKYPEEEFIVNNDIVLNSTGSGTLGRVAIYHNDDNPNCHPVAPNSHIIVIKNNVYFKFTFLYYTGADTAVVRPAVYVLEVKCGKIFSQQQTINLKYCEPNLTN